MVLDQDLNPVMYLLNVLIPAKEIFSVSVTDGFEMSSLSEEESTPK
jgi:hypothetical protein